MSIADLSRHEVSGVLNDALRRRHNRFGREFTFEILHAGVEHDGFHVRVVDEKLVSELRANRAHSWRQWYASASVYFGRWEDDDQILDAVFDAASRALAALLPWAGKLRRIATRALMPARRLA